MIKYSVEHPNSCVGQKNVLLDKKCIIEIYFGIDLKTAFEEFVINCYEHNLELIEP